MLLKIKLSLIDAVGRAFDFSGRTSRAPYLIASAIIGLCAVLLQACEIWLLSWKLGELEPVTGLMFKGMIFFCLFLLASLFVRRNHDMGESALAFLNPFDRRNNSFFAENMVWDAGDPEENRFGPPHSLW